MQSGQYTIWELTLKTLTLAGLVVGACWGYFTYMDTKEKEFYTTFWNKKLELFLEVSNAASTMATTTSIEEFDKARSKYLELFYGRLSLVEGHAVKDAMITFSAFVPKEPLNESDLPQVDMQQPAYRLTLELKKELGRAWQKPFGEL